MLPKKFPFRVGLETVTCFPGVVRSLKSFRKITHGIQQRLHFLLTLKFVHMYFKHSLLLTNNCTSTLPRFLRAERAERLFSCLVKKTAFFQKFPRTRVVFGNLNICKASSMQTVFLSN